MARNIGIVSHACKSFIFYVHICSQYVAVGHTKKRSPSSMGRPLCAVTYKPTIRWVGRHMYHMFVSSWLHIKADYVEWATANHFTLMLPNNTKQQWTNATLSAQPSRDKHLVCKEPVVKYTDSRFCNLTVCWLIDMDQVCFVCCTGLSPDVLHYPSPCIAASIIPNHDQSCLPCYKWHHLSNS